MKYSEILLYYRLKNHVPHEARYNTYPRDTRLRQHWPISSSILFLGSLSRTLYRMSLRLWRILKVTAIQHTT